MRKTPTSGHWQVQPVDIPTRWAKDVCPENVWPDYPRPQMVRDQWTNLNGLWDYLITGKDEMAAAFEGLILVPFPLESALSGVQKRLTADQRLWYRRTFTHRLSQVPGERTLLHFGAVDFEAIVHVNGRTIGAHRGGYQHFTFEISEALVEGENEIVVQVFDPTNKGIGPHGKQRLGADWAFYTPSSGIWQTVWLEHVPATYIEHLRLTPDVDRCEIQVEVAVEGAAASTSIEVVIESEGQFVARASGNGTLRIELEQPRLWSPSDPHLYDLTVRLVRSGEVIDTVKSYVGMRKVEVRADRDGFPRIFLNGEYVFNLGVVDQGFWPDGLYTAPSDAALKFDLEAAKALGFNCVRKHIKVEPDRWYHHADRIGLMVWQDMPSGLNGCEESRTQFEREVEQNIRQLHHFPCIVVWVPFNEGWGVYDQARITSWIKELDQSRLVNGHSGPFDHIRIDQTSKCIDPVHLPSPFGQPFNMMEALQACQYRVECSAGDVSDFHWYPGPRTPPYQEGVAATTGEHGSFGVFVEGHVLEETRATGKGVGARSLSPAEFREAYAASITQQKILEAQGLSGSQYFQLSDVETEQQGFLTYDREVVKLPVETVELMNALLVPARDASSETASVLAIQVADQRSERERYAELLEQYRAGDCERDVLRRVALMAARQGDATAAAVAADAWLAGEPEPFSERAWRFVSASTISSSGRGFGLLSHRYAEANRVLGHNAAEQTIVEIVRREAVDPYFSGRALPPEWNELEALTERFGRLGLEAVDGVRMMHDLVHKDWSAFAQSYVRYFSAARGRSAYKVQTLAHQVLLHVDALETIACAIEVMKHEIETDSEFKFGMAVDLDLYAQLLHKAGRSSDAIRWQRQAVALADGISPEIAANLRKLLDANDLQ